VFRCQSGVANLCLVRFIFRREKSGSGFIKLRGLGSVTKREQKSLLASAEKNNKYLVNVSVKASKENLRNTLLQIQGTD
jgi:hypothetical protein